MSQTYRRTCKLESCSSKFRTNRKNQEFCKPKCRYQAFIEAKYQAEYERGWNDGILACAGIIEALNKAKAGAQ